MKSHEKLPALYAKLQSSVRTAASAYGTIGASSYRCWMRATAPSARASARAMPLSKFWRRDAMASFGRSIFAALTLACLIGAPPAVGEAVLRIANMAEPESLDPHKTSAQFQINITRNLFEGLVVLDPKGNVAPGVAESWS